MKHKYPRTYHLPFSGAIHSDDKVIKDYNSFVGKEVVITEKMDGENTTMSKDYVHARSLDSAHNYTRDWIRRLHSILSHDIPEGYRLCGENLAYYHSIEYNNLDGFFYLFSVWDDKNKCLSWNDTLTPNEAIKKIRLERENWVRNNNTHNDKICKNNCLDVCVDYNNRHRKLNSTPLSKQNIQNTPIIISTDNGKCGSGCGGCQCQK